MGKSDKTMTKKVLVIPGRITGGVGAVVMNLYRNIDRNLVAYDFCVPESDPGVYKDEIINSGGHIFSIPLIKKGPFRFVKTLVKIMKENGPYDAVHIHSVHMGALALLAAKKASIKKRIYHVHNTQNAAFDNLIGHAILEQFLRLIINLYSTDRLACGAEAGRFVYGSHKDFVVINNAIDITRFFPMSKYEQDRIKNEFELDDKKIIIGNVARFNLEKNQAFFVELAIEDREDNLFFLMVGDGELRPEIENKARDNGVSHKFLFLGNQDNVERLYNVMDVFCLPSFFEGLPVTAIEAQACGIPCIVSDRITEEADMKIGLYKRLSLNTDKAQWIESLINSAKLKINDKELIREALVKNRYEIQSIIEKIYSVYGVNI